MKHYELFYLVSVQVPETQLDGVQDEITKLIIDAGGTVTRTETWGRKRLAYPIAKERHGFYLLQEFDFEPEKLKDLERKLTLHKTILRYILLIKKPISEREKMAQERAVQRAQARAVKEQAEERAKDVIATEHKEVPKIRLDELDKKLDELLDHDLVN
jgi:small subunit ribosomal protein S6